MAYVDYIAEVNKFTLNKPVNSNKIYYSELNEWFTTNAFRSFSIKYVVDGIINYRNANKKFDIIAGNFLLATQQPDVKAYFESDELTRSICIDICPRFMNEAYSILDEKKDIDPDNYLAGYFKAPDFYDHVIHLDRSLIHREISVLAQRLARHELSDVSDEWFLMIVEKILAQEFPNFQSINKVEAKKAITRKEIYERVSNGKEYMDEMFLNNPEIKDVALQCNLSPYHFFRSFKQVFRISPYQYMLNKRLESAKELLLTTELTVSEIATVTSFPDVFTFSKAFKKRIGVSPTNFRNDSKYNNKPKNK